MRSPYASISLVCVYNDPDIRRQCLDRSIAEMSDQASDVEYLPIENVDGRFPSAGAALNHGVSLAKNQVVVFAHQDVYLHSLTALKQAAGQLRAGGFGVLGAVGVRSDSLLVGRIRDRVLLAGAPVTLPVAVDSVDEVLFMASRGHLLSEPLTESPDLAWHAYAVEYGLRMRCKGQPTGVANVPLTHNSLSVNLARLDDAHQAVAERYAELLPVITTCGTISARTAHADRAKWFPSHRWRYRWLRDSMSLRRCGIVSHLAVRVLADIRYDVDAVIERAPGRRLYIINCAGNQAFTQDSKPLELRRRDGVVVFSDHASSNIPVALKACPIGSWTLLTNLSQMDITMLESELSERPSVIGFHVGTGLWLLLGPAAGELPPQWRSSRATPLGARS